MTAILARMGLTYLLLFAVQIAEPAPQRVRTAKAAHFEVTAHFDSQATADQALAAAEGVIPFVRTVYGDIVVDPRLPLTIHVFESRAALMKSELARSHGVQAFETAFTCDEGRTAFIALYPELSADAFALAGLPLATRFDIAHAAVELCARQAWIHAPGLPYWFAEGAAVWGAEEACGAQKWVQNPAEDPATSTRMLSVQRLLVNDTLPPFFAILDGIPAGLTRTERRAVAAAAFRFVKAPARAEFLKRIVDAARQVTAEEDAQAVVARAARSALGTEEAQGTLQLAFDEWVRQQSPAWDEVEPSLWPLGNTWIQVAGERNAISWRALPPRNAQYELSGSVALLPGAHRQANVLLARRLDSFVQVSFIADYGIDVFHFDAARGVKSSWKKLATAEVADLTEGAFHPFKIVAGAERLEIWLADKPVLSLAPGEVPLTGSWGLGAYAGTTCLWLDLKERAAE